MFAVRDSQGYFTEAHYSDFNQMYLDWWFEFAKKTHKFVRVSV
jgi:hypothetical protein